MVSSIGSSTAPPHAKGALLFRFAVIADSHLNPAEHGNTSPWQTNHLANPRNEVVVDAVNELKPCFTVHVGDVVHPLPHTSEYAPAARYARSLYSRLKAPLYIAPGNHDIGDKCLLGNPAATISEESCKTYEEHFGKQWQSFEHGDACFLIVNSCLLGSGTPQEKEQWEWLVRTLAENRSKRKFLFTHYPPFITDPAEEDHYDNIDRQPRAAFIELLTANDVEALFAGHVHTFFLNRFGSTWSYALPSSTNFRQDYAELFRVEPEEELGRNDLGKFGFFVVDVHERGHVARFVRTYGSVNRDEAHGIATDLGLDIRSSSHQTVGLDMCHDWTGITQLPYNPPLDTFVRKRVRNDYPVLNLWDCGVRSIRIPVQDVEDSGAYNRVRLACDLGHDVTVFSVGLPSPLALDRLLTLGSSMRALEIITHQDPVLLDTSALPPDIRRVTYAAPLYSPKSHTPGAPFDHTMACGIPSSDASQIAALSGSLSLLSPPMGLLVRITQDQPVLESLQTIRDARAKDANLMVNVCLSPTKSSDNNVDDEAIAGRAAEAAVAALIYPELIVRIDTFMDIDRGYFPRHGVVDRRNNPRLAAISVREVYDRLGAAVDLRLVCMKRGEGRVLISLDSNQGPVEMAISSRAGDRNPTKRSRRPDGLIPVISWKR